MMAKCPVRASELQGNGQAFAPTASWHPCKQVGRDVNEKILTRSRWGKAVLDPNAALL
jgi:hypothetical protein